MVVTGSSVGRLCGIEIHQCVLLPLPQEVLPGVTQERGCMYLNEQLRNDFWTGIDNLGTPAAGGL